MLLILLFKILSTAHALPIPPVLVEEKEATSSCDTLDGCRTLWNIIWSCLATIFACTWVAIHPNIPGAKETATRIALRRVGQMVLALIAPEFVVLWAMRQWLVARRLSEKYRERGWTETHGFFVLMGGFVLYEDGQASETLLPEKSEFELILSQEVTQKEIQDKSKGDILSKGLVIIQTAWFVLQCVARRVQHLPLTQLEVVTLAFATLNLVTYVLWWNKPLNVQCPIVVHRTKDVQQEAENKGNRQSQESGACELHTDAIKNVAGTVHIMHIIGDSMKSLAHQIPVALRRVFAAVRSATEAARNATTTAVADAKARGFLASLGRGASVAFEYVVLMPTAIALYPFSKMAGFEDGYNEVEKRVSSFYSGDLKPEEASCAILTTAVLATTFGIIHCLTWSVAFSSQAEQTQWFACSLAITCIPASVVFMILLSQFKWIRQSFPTGVIVWALPAVYAFASALYFIARVTLLVQTFTSLEVLPPGAYQAVHWTTFIPHL